MALIKSCLTSGGTVGTPEIIAQSASETNASLSYTATKDYVGVCYIGPYSSYSGDIATLNYKINNVSKTATGTISQSLGSSQLGVYIFPIEDLNNGDAFECTFSKAQRGTLYGTEA